MTQKRSSSSTLKACTQPSERPHPADSLIESHEMLLVQSDPPQSPTASDTQTLIVPFAQDDSDLERVNVSLRLSDLFLGNPKILENVKWVPDGRHHKLVLKARDGDDNFRKPAVLEWVGEISPSNFWLYACARWNGERGPMGLWEKPSPFETAKARARVQCPTYIQFVADWQACVNNLNSLMKLHMKLNSRIALSILQDNEVKIRHGIFEVRTPSYTVI
jgi:hypothetical protein